MNVKLLTKEEFEKMYPHIRRTHFETKDNAMWTKLTDEVNERVLEAALPQPTFNTARQLEIAQWVASQQWPSDQRLKNYGPTMRRREAKEEVMEPLKAAQRILYEMDKQDAEALERMGKTFSNLKPGETIHVRAPQRYTVPERKAAEQTRPGLTPASAQWINDYVTAEQRIGKAESAWKRFLKYLAG